MTIGTEVDPGLERSIRQRTVLVAIENDLTRYGIASMLGQVATVGEIWTCRSEEQAMIPLGQHRPDILICQGGTPGALSLVQAAKRYATQILLLLEDLDLTMVEETTLVTADGFLLQDKATVEMLRAAMDRLASDELLLPSELARSLMMRARGGTPSRTVPAICLTPREQEVLGLLSQGLSNKQIARRLTISEHGVKRHVTSLLAKLNAPNRTLAVAVALQQGLISSDG